jgi:cysteine desulfurase
VIVSAIEHNSVLGPAEHLEQRGFEVQRLPVTRHGIARLDVLREWVRPDTRLVSLMLVNNETGVVQPVAEAADICREFGLPFHADAVQAVGKLPVDFTALGVTALTVTPHKFHGPRGIGALIVKHDAPLRPILFGGFQQASLRPGTESVTLAVGMQTALELILGDASLPARLAAARDRFETNLRAQLPDVVVHGASTLRAPHTSNVSFPGVDRQLLVLALDLAGVACSTGSACASGSTDPSHVLGAMGVADTALRSALRFSFGRDTSFVEIDLSVERIAKSVKELRAGKFRRKD